MGDFPAAWRDPARRGGRATDLELAARGGSARRHPIFESTGVIEDRLLDRALEDFLYPCAKQGAGIITFAEQSEIDVAFASAADSS
ncbi:hypothetical protein [Bradyrhizobium murdochi]|uniref:hypothetical protein n=1 Tax=Bradyrhizobium murdochi TaxID=1038859 RepID=UPI000488AD79